MRLIRFDVRNYRNVYLDCALTFSDYTLLVGGNNQGKTNVLKAIDVANNIIKSGGHILVSRQLSFFDDYPKDKQNSLSACQTYFEMHFNLSKEEQKKFFMETGVRNNGSLILGITANYSMNRTEKGIRRVPVKVTFSIKGKRGRAASSYKSNMNKVCDYISSNFDYVYVPAIRNEDDSTSILRDLVSLKIRELNSDNDYLEQLNSIYEKERDAVSTIKGDLIRDLQEYVPEIRDIDIGIDNYGRIPMRSDLDFAIDDGAKTSIKNKGAGIISLIALALIQGQSNSNSMVAIEEPESHLHADSIHKISQKLIKASSGKQIIVSTHNPSFLNSNNLNNVYLIKNGHVNKSKEVSSIREELGLSAKDSLFISDNVIVVEGESDRRFIERLIKEYSQQLGNMLKIGTLEIYPAKSSTKIIPMISECKRWMVDFFAIFDNDNSGKNDYSNLNNIQQSYLIPLVNGKKECELEDIVPSPIVVNVMNEFGANVSEKEYIRNKRKFNDYLAQSFNKYGIDLSEETIRRIKTRIMDLFVEADFNVINRTLLDIYKILVQRLENHFLNK